MSVPYERNSRKALRTHKNYKVLFLPLLHCADNSAVGLSVPEGIVSSLVRSFVQFRQNKLTNYRWCIIDLRVNNSTHESVSMQPFNLTFRGDG